MSSNNTAPMSGTIEGGLGMSGEWREVAIRDICIKIGSGATPRGGKESYRGGDTNLIRSQNVYNDGFRTDGLVRIDERQASELRNVEVIAGDVLLNITGDSVARCCTAPMAILPARVNQHVAIIRTKPEIADSAFLRYTLVSAQMQDKLMSMSSAGATRPALTKGMIERLVVHLPPLPEQRRIAKILGDLDDKIELNRKMNETLEQMARALFKSWFIDFDPVRAKMAGRQPPGMDTDTAALFPSRLVESELGLIPEGWSAKPLPDVIEVNPRRTLKSGTVAPYLDMKNLPTQGHSAEEVVDREFASGTKFRNGDTLLARITPCLENGKTGFVDFLKDGEVGWGSTEYIVFAPKPPLPPQFGYLLARSDALRSHAIQNMTGTSGRQRVPTECFSTFWLAVPTTDLDERFDELTAPLMAQIKSNIHQSRTLASLRDTLLPQLMRGGCGIREGG
jgi:type I restriction enzyme S subunit